MSQNYYKILEVSKNSTNLDLKKAFLKLSHKFHPVTSLELNAEENFRLICEAYDLLNQKKWRTLYDQKGYKGIKEQVPLNEEGQTLFGCYNFHGDCYKMFKDFFGVACPTGIMRMIESTDEKFMNLRKENKGITAAPRGKTVYLEAEVPLETVYTGGHQTIAFTRQIFNKDGKLIRNEEDRFTVPIATGSKLITVFYFHQKAHQEYRATPGDVVITLKEKPHPQFYREGNNLVMRKDIKFATSVAGTVLDLKSLCGDIRRYPFTGGIYHGCRKFVEGEGLPLEDQPSVHGDMIVEFNVVYPMSCLSPQNKDLIKQVFDCPPQSKQEGGIMVYSSKKNIVQKVVKR